MRILLVEDDNLIGGAVKQALQDNAYAVDWVQDGNVALLAVKTEDYDLVLLDLGLPDKDGLQVLSELRQAKKTMPVIIVTARDAVEDRIKGLDLGADDYLVKPFSIEELEARIRAIVRRQHGLATPLLTNGELILDPTTREVTYNGQVQILSAREYALLYEFLLRPGAILSRNELEERLYGWNEEVASNAIEFLIHGIRKKLHKSVIKNIRGLGWMVSK